MTLNAPIFKPSKKQLEQAHVDGFLAESAVLPGATAQASHAEPPDFVVQHSGVSISIELRRVFADEQIGAGSPLREAESLRQYVCERVQQSLIGKTSSPQLVFIGFAYRRFSKNRANAIATDIVRLLSANPLVGEGTLTLNWKEYTNRGEYGTVWPEELDHISVHQGADIAHHQVTAPDAGFVLEECAPILQAAISEKNADLHRYSSAYGERWLLLVTEGVGPASFIAPDALARQNAYKSDFNRVFFFDAFVRKWCELKTTPASSAP